MKAVNELCGYCFLSFWHVFKREIGASAGGGGDLSNYFFHLQERVGNFLADFYSVNGLVLESRKRREHLSEEDILRNKAIMESLSKGGNLIEQNFEVSRASNVADCRLSFQQGGGVREDRRLLNQIYSFSPQCPRHHHSWWNNWGYGAPWSITW